MPKTWTVDRKTWYRGKTSEQSALRRESDGMMCCLGHRSLACGLTPEMITDIKAPSTLRDKGLAGGDWDQLLNPNLSEIWKKHSLAGYAIMKTNDDPGITDNTREYTLKQLFYSIGESVEFVG